MRTQASTEQNPPLGIVPAIRLTAPWRAVSVDVQDAHSFRVRFTDGLEGTVRMEPSHLTGVFAVLRDAAVFQQARIEYGVVTWPGDIDLAPDAMYDAIKTKGEWVLT